MSEYEQKLLSSRRSSAMPAGPAGLQAAPLFGRPARHAQLEGVRTALNESPRTQAVAQLQQTANRSPRVTQLATLATGLQRPTASDTAHAQEDELRERAETTQCAATREAAAPGDPGALPPAGPPHATTPNRTGLPDGLKAGIETRSGLSMDDVRVHRNSSKPAQLQALAYAQGTNIHLGPGQERHLPHEAWHVVQQKQGRVRPTARAEPMAINAHAGDDEKPLQRKMRIGDVEFDDNDRSLIDSTLRRIFKFEQMRADESVISQILSVACNPEERIYFSDWEQAIAHFAVDDVRDHFSPHAVPQLIHFIWLGKPPTIAAIKNIIEWAKLAQNTGWKIYLWTDSRVNVGDWDESKRGLKGKIEIKEIKDDLDPILEKHYESVTGLDQSGDAKAFNIASDLARWAILSKYGGVYADVDLGPGEVNLNEVTLLKLSDLPIAAPSIRDMTALKEQLPKGFEDKSFAEQLEATVEDAYSKNQLNTNLIVSHPKTIFIEKMIRDMIATLNRNSKASREDWAEMGGYLTGPGALSRAMVAYLREKYPEDNTPSTFAHMDKSALKIWRGLEWLTEESENQIYDTQSEVSGSEGSSTSSLSSTIKNIPFFSRFTKSSAASSMLLRSEAMQEEERVEKGEKGKERMESRSRNPKPPSGGNPFDEPRDPEGKKEI